jgi:hypothetical protein
MTETLEGTLEEKPPHGSPEWLAARHRDADGRARLTASIAGVLFGEHEFIRPSNLALQMLRDEPPDEETTEAMERGTALEPSLLDYWALKHGEQIERPSHMFVRGRWLANLDGICWSLDVPVEAKTTTHRWKGELLPYWCWQGVAQRWCFSGMAGAVEWVILDGNLRFHFHEQWVMQAEIDELLAAGDEWLSYVDLGIPPVGVDLDAKQIATLNLGAEGMVELPPDARDWVDALIAARAMKKQAEAEEETAKTWLAQHLAGKDVGTINGQVAVTWREQAGRKSFATKEFAVEYPELYEKFMRQGPSFRSMLPKAEK